MAELVLQCNARQAKWQDDDHPFARVGPETLAVVEYLEREDPARTVLLQHYPDRPPFISLLCERRPLLAWSRHARASASPQAEIDALLSLRADRDTGGVLDSRALWSDARARDHRHRSDSSRRAALVTSDLINDVDRLYSVPVDAEETR